MKSVKHLLFCLAALFVVSSVNAQQLYNDAAAFDLRNNVQRAEILSYGGVEVNKYGNSSCPYTRIVITFNEQGQISSYTNANNKTFTASDIKLTIVREGNRLSRVLNLSFRYAASGGVSVMTRKQVDMSTIDYFFYSNGSLYEDTHSYIEEKSQGQQTSKTFTYEYLRFDDWGNWTARLRVENGETMLEERIITYHPSAVKPSSLQLPETNPRQVYHDARAFDLRGHVKSLHMVKIASNSVQKFYSKYRFDVWGRISYFASGEDQNNLKACADEVLQQRRGSIHNIQEFNGIRYVFTKNRLRREITSWGFESDYSYDSKGYVTQTSEGHEYGEIVDYNYNYLAFDSQGNWTKREHRVDDVVYTESRKIEYYSQSDLAAAKSAQRATKSTPKPTTTPAKPKPHADSNKKDNAESDRQAVALQDRSEKGEKGEEGEKGEPKSDGDGGSMFAAMRKIGTKRLAPYQLPTMPMAMYRTHELSLSTLCEYLSRDLGAGSYEVIDGDRSNIRVKVFEPQGFALIGVAGYNAMPCRDVMARYTQGNTTKMGHANFTYDLPMTWNIAQIRDFAAAVNSALSAKGIVVKESNISRVASYNYSGKDYNLTIIYFSRLEDSSPHVTFFVTFK